MAVPPFCVIETSAQPASSTVAPLFGKPRVYTFNKSASSYESSLDDASESSRISGLTLVHLTW